MSLQAELYAELREAREAKRLAEQSAEWARKGWDIADRRAAEAIATTVAQAIAALNIPDGMRLRAIVDDNPSNHRISYVEVTLLTENNHEMVTRRAIITRPVAELAFKEYLP